MLKDRNLAFVNTENITGDDIFDIAEKNDVATIYIVGANLHFYGRLRELGRTPALVQSLDDLPPETFLYYHRPGYWATFHPDGAVDDVTYATNSLRAAEKLLLGCADFFSKSRAMRAVTISQTNLPQPLTLMMDEMNSWPSAAFQSLFDQSGRRLDPVAKQDFAQHRSQ
jgi:hypothetical protein